VGVQDKILLGYCCSGALPMTELAIWLIGVFLEGVVEGVGDPRWSKYD
jgi:hypothetical protein